MRNLVLKTSNTRELFAQNGFSWALGAIGIIFFINLFLQRTIPGYFPMSLYLSAVVIAACAAGTRAGLFAMVVGGIIEISSYDIPAQAFKNSVDVARVTVYFFESIFLVYIFSKVHSWQQRLVENEEKLASALNRETTNLRKMELAMTALQQSQAELTQERETARNANKVKSLFLAHMSHEIRTPLVSVLGFADLLKDENLSRTERLHYLSIIERTGNNLKNIINDILDISKVEAGHLSVNPHQFNLHGMLQDLKTVMELKSVEKGIALDIEMDELCPKFIVGDSERMRQILVNLIGNAIKFTDEGSVKVTCRTLNDSLIFQIQDSGIGISEKQQRLLFQNFSQGESSVSRRYGGTGLGLALSRALANKMDGDIQLIESSVGKGSLFEFTMKFTLASQSEAIPETQQTPEVPLELAGKKILLVDDCEENLVLFQHFLKKMGPEIDLARNGVEALVLVEQKQFDLILMDMQMPLMDGYTATKILRKEGYQVPVIAITAHALKEDAQRCYNAGCDGYLSKPLQKSDLLSAIQRATTFTQLEVS